MSSLKNDKATAAAFADSWNNLPAGSVYTQEQFVDWMAPLTCADLANKTVLELGCGNGSLMMHVARHKPSLLMGVDLGAAVVSAKKNLSEFPTDMWQLVQEDLTTFRSPGFDIVYCIGVLHHLQVPEKGFESLVKNTKKGGSFHAWVYAREGNTVIVGIVDPIRRVSSRLPWWITKYLLATPLVIPYFIYSKLLAAFKNISCLKKLPLFEYSLWIARRDFAFFRHVAFDQLVAPQTAYIRKETIETWLKSFPEIDQASTYIIFRNGNSWKFGGRLAR